MTRSPGALAVIDAGAATTSLALLGRPGTRWRLLGSLAVPSGVDEDELLSVLAARIRAVDPDLAEATGLSPAKLSAVPRLASRSSRPRTLALLGASRRSVALLEAVVARTAWRVKAASTETHDPREMTELALRADVSAVLASAGDPPGPDERPALDDLAALVAAVARRRPELQIVLGGSLRGRRAWTEDYGTDDQWDPARIVEAPAAGGRTRTDEGLRAVLEGLLADPLDGRRALGPAAASLADLLDRRIEVLDIGHDGGARVLASPGAAGDEPSTTALTAAAAALLPAPLDDALVDQVLAWTTGSLDRHRMADRLRDLRASPWSDQTDDGARLRLAAARAALARLAGLTRDLSDLAAPDLTIVSGGAFAAAPAGAAILAVADTIRRTGATQVAADPARLLGPIGTIEDPAERRALLADVAGDLLVPLGTMLLAAGVRPRRDGAPVGEPVLAADGSASRHALTAGDLAFVDLAPGVQARATLEFRDLARIGRRTRRAAVSVTGGLAGLLVDLRDVPLRLPERRDRRRAALAGWSNLGWPGGDR